MSRKLTFAVGQTVQIPLLDLHNRPFTAEAVIKKIVLGTIYVGLGTDDLCYDPSELAPYNKPPASPVVIDSE